MTNLDPLRRKIIEPFSKEVMDEVVECLLGRADRERKASEPYKNLFKRTEGKPFPVQLREVERDLTNTILNYSKILEANGYKVNDETWEFLLALPILAHKLEEDIKKNEGRSCGYEYARDIVKQARDELSTNN